MDSDAIRATILRNAEEIRRLKGCIDETFKHRDEGATQMAEWADAATKFSEKYDELAFLDKHGYEHVIKRMRQGDHDSIEWALCFLECRPYFFRSGYVYKDLLRVLKNVPMLPEHQARAETIREKYRRYREIRGAISAVGGDVGAEPADPVDKPRNVPSSPRPAP